MRRPLPITRPGDLGVFTARSAYRQNWTADALEHAVRCGRIVRLTRGIYIDAMQMTGATAADAQRHLAIRTVAATMAVAGAVPSHASAALLAGLPIWDIPDRPCITVQPGSSGDAQAAHLHRAGLPDEHVLPGQIPRTRAARTVFDIAREHGIEDAVVAGDAALRRAMTDPERLLDVAGFCRSWPGARRARRVLELLDARSESPIESVSRLRIGAGSLPAPIPQVEIYTLTGEFLGRLDFYWELFGVAGEVDGRQKYLERADDVIWREKKRQELMEDTGVLFVRWGRAELEHMRRLEERIARVLARGARRPVSDRAWIARPTEPRVALLGALPR